MKTIPVKTIYLEMKSYTVNSTELGDDVIIIKVHKPTVEFYKFLYGNTGKDLMWVDRLMMNEEKLIEIITNPCVKIFVLYYRGNPAGYVELDCRIKDEVEVAYFGLMPEYRGKKLGKCLLNYAIAEAFKTPIKRVWLHTCELDHPAALGIYKRAGFSIYDEKIIQQNIPS